MYAGSQFGTGTLFFLLLLFRCAGGSTPRCRRIELAKYIISLWHFIIAIISINAVSRTLRMSFAPLVVQRGVYNVHTP